MELAVGSRWRSTVCSTEVAVVRAPGEARTLTCGGAEMVAIDADAPRGPIDPAFADGTLIGKRYTDESSGIEVLCTKAGEGSLALDGERLLVKGAKPLPSSD